MMEVKEQATSEDAAPESSARQSAPEQQTIVNRIEFRRATKA